MSEVVVEIFGHISVFDLSGSQIIVMNTHFLPCVALIFLVHAVNRLDVKRTACVWRSCTI